MNSSTFTRHLAKLVHQYSIQSTTMPVIGGRATAALWATQLNTFARSLSTYDVKPFGQLVFQGQGSVHVTPLNPQDHPDMDKCTLHCDRDELEQGVTVDGDVCTVNSDTDTETDTWHIKLPIQYAVSVHCGGHATVSGMESPHVSVTAAGDVTLTGIRSGDVTVRTDAALTVRRLLLGNISVEAQAVDSSDARLQGQTISVTAHQSCHLADIYADTVHIDVATADLRVGTIHGDAMIRADEGTSEMVIGGVDGCVDVSAPHAAVRCHIHRLSGDSRVHCDGAMWVTLAPSARCTLLVPGPPPLLDSGIEPGETGDDGVHACRVGDADGPRLTLVSDTRPVVSIKSWAATVAGWP